MRKLMLVAALAALGLACAGSGTYTTGTGYASVGVSTEPRVMYVEEYPGWLWVEGHYARTGSRIGWVEGYWVEHRPGYVYRPSYYDVRSRIYIDGGWSRGAHYQSYYRMPRGQRVYRVPPPHHRRYHRRYY